jgi:poly-gamma-glutamate synthesis protein (capsule biosynthesis protein)
VVFAATTRFDTIFPITTWERVQAAWTSAGDAETDDQGRVDARTESGDGSEKPAEEATGTDAATDTGTDAETEPTPEEALAAALSAAEDRAIAAGMYVSEDELIEAGKTDPSVGANLADEYDLDRAPDFTSVAVLSDTLPLLAQVLGEAGPTVQGYADMEGVIEAAWADEGVLALVPFDELDPRLATLAIDGQNPIENANRFDIDQYPFIATLYAHVDAANAGQQELADAFLAQIPPTNRDPNKLTVLAMTGVTAMVRFSAAQIDRYGPEWVAEVVGPELAAADITHISNEVPFAPDCETNTSADNFNFCSPPSYMAALEDSGVDIIGLTGNHQNDYGREAALGSLDIYEEAGLPVYGGGRNREAAFAPLYLEHNGNRLAFLGANSYGPEFAWATDALPGSAKFNLAIMSATIRSIKQKDLADVVLPELQYQESYDTTPLIDQRLDFTALVRAGADIVTGVQSHVPQGVELDEDKMILYGLGNLYFDQMWSHPTREGMIIKHTFYDGRHIGTQILTTLLYDYAQPRWTSADERESLLEGVFDASYWNIDR